MDRIMINDLLVRCIIGVRDEERREMQDVIINITLFTSLRKAGKSDRLEDTVDYHALKKMIINKAQTWQFYLIEAVADSVASLCLRCGGVHKVTVKIEKPSALRFARSVSVEITRSRKR
ncbi:MAG TPA: dihydroneopterin aldolase [Nitrospirota bacterium]|nr:dihydroneopterin aldolase [Nitrospirota bacterium]